MFFSAVFLACKVSMNMLNAELFQIKQTVTLHQPSKKLQLTGGWSDGACLFG